MTRLRQEVPNPLRTQLIVEEMACCRDSVRICRGHPTCFNRLKGWRGLATRYDKHAVIYRGAVVLAAIMLWLR